MSPTDKNPARRSTRCLLLSPEFKTASFWNYREACRIKGSRYPGTPLGLLTVAAMLPQDWELKLCDRNVEDFDESLLDWADVVFIGGMIPQQQDHLQMIALAHSKGKIVVSGGPDATSSPHVYDAADHLVLGEAEVTLPAFLADFKEGQAKHVYQSKDQADVTQSPVPRWDLVTIEHYAYLGFQWSRGCPFNCEFCDIIELFGRVPRHKTTEQVLRELDNLYSLGYRGAIDVVDDNFIGNQKAVMELLEALRGWQERHGWPFEFGTEASLNLADRPKIMAAMRDAGFSVIFVGIETPDEDTLRSTQKRQNTRRDIAESVRTLYDYGIMVMAGYIIGLDDESPDMASRMITCIQDTSVPVNMVGLLFALPNTQLSRRLKREGRIKDGFELVSATAGSDQCAEGLNFDTQRPTEDILADYIKVLEAVYTPEAYFDRVLRMGLALNRKSQKLNLGLKGTIADAVTFGRMIRDIGLKREWGHHWWRVFLIVLVKNPRAIRYALWMGALYTHFGDFVPWVTARLTERRNTILREKAAQKPSIPAENTRPAASLTLN